MNNHRDIIRGTLTKTESSECSADSTRTREIGEIQSCGYLFIVENEDGITTNPAGWSIVGASRNVETAWCVDVGSTCELRGKSIGHVFHGQNLKTVCALLRRCTVKLEASSEHISLRANRNIGKIHTVCTKTRGQLVRPAQQPTNQHRGGRGNTDTSDSDSTERRAMSCTVTCISNPGWLVVEVEEEEEGTYQNQASGEPTTGLLEAAKVLERVPLKRSPQESLSELADAFIERFPFDRVMVYRFESDNCGTVIYESLRPGSEVSSSYEGLRFPAADIPPSVRELLRLTGVRYIANTAAPGVPVDLFRGGVEGVDLSMSSLRAPSECHLTYLRNMGVKSSLVVAIIVDTQLWGLFSFHSYASLVKLSSEERVMIELATTVTSSLISYHQRQKETETSLRLSHTLGNLHTHSRIHSFLSAEHLNLLSILDIDTILVSNNSQPAAVFGNEDISLTPEECKALLNGTQSNHMVKFASVEARGVALFSVRSFALFFLRGSVAAQVKWAGNPDTPLLDKERLHPRASFEMFMKTSAAKVEPWSQATADLLSKVRNGVVSHLYEEALPVDLHERVAQISHELRTPFHGVMSALDVLRAENAYIPVGERDAIIDTAISCGTSMMSTLDDILDVAKDRHNTELVCNSFIASSPIHMAATALKHFAAENAIKLGALPSAAASTTPSNSTTAGKFVSAGRVNAGLHEVIGDEQSIQRILLNLVSNAIKFTPSEGKVDISLQVFDSLEKVTAWWGIETNRFDANVWIGNPPDTEGVEDAGISAASTRAPAGEAEPPPGAPQRWYVYSVEDTGVGISPGNLSSITKAYRQVSEGASKAYQGTGLGLHICVNHVQAMLGCLGVASRPAEESSRGRSGTLFAVVLPLLCSASKLTMVRATPDGSQEVKEGVEALTAQAEVAAAAITGARSGWGAENGGPRKVVAIVVVDDQVVNAKLMKMKIEGIFKHSRGRVKVLTASDGLAALELVTTVHDDEANDNETDADDTPTKTVVAGMFMDYHMPRMDGIGCTRRIRSMETEKGWPRTYICGFTADVSEAARDKFRDAGGQDTIGKPFTTGQVESVCKTMLLDVLKREDSSGQPSKQAG